MSVSVKRRYLAAGLLVAFSILTAGVVLASAGRSATADTDRVQVEQSDAATPGSTYELATLWTRAVLYVQARQRELHRELAGAIKTLRKDGSATAAWSLIAISFLYGVFHAAGPGHGKAIISTYLLTHRSAVRRGLWLSAVASLTQGLTAIVVVLVLVVVIGWTRKDAQGAVGTLETVSFALIALLGITLAGRALWSMTRAFWPIGAPMSARVGRASPPTAHGCAHGHSPDPNQLSEPMSWKTMAAIVLSIGIRPCSGAVLVLLFAEVLDLRLAGILAVLAMSVGTTVTVASLAVVAVNFRRLAGYMAGNGRHFALAGQAVSLVGGILITALGASLFIGSLGARHPLL